MAPEQECAFRNIVSDNSSCEESEKWEKNLRDEIEDECLEEIVSVLKSTPSQKMKLALLSLIAS